MLSALDTPSSPLSFERLANRFIVVLLGLQRVSHGVAATIAIGSDPGRDLLISATLLATAAAWNCWLFWRASGPGWFSPGLVGSDVVVTCLLLVAIRQPPDTTWAVQLSQATAALVGAAARPVWLAVGCFTALVLANTASLMAVPLPEAGPLLTEICRLGGLTGFVLIVGFAMRYLRREGRELDAATARRLAVEAELAADRARQATSLSYHRALHDTVLATLTTISVGGLDHRTAEVRARCARDVDYVRRMLAAGPTATGVLAEKLADVVAAAQLLGLRIHHRYEGGEPDLPADVVETLGEATREVLNNVARHAGVTQAWTTVSAAGGGVRILVVDRGRGFDPTVGTDGFGLRRSVVDRVAAAGGRVRLSSGPAEGTSVELVWPG